MLLDSKKMLLSMTVSIDRQKPCISTLEWIILLIQELHGASRIQIQPCSLKQWTMWTEENSVNIWYQLVMSIEGKRVRHVRMVPVRKGAAPQKTESKWIKWNSLTSLSRHSRYSRTYRQSKTLSRCSWESRAINHEICLKRGRKNQDPEFQIYN